jgi:hypothetical protein
LPPLRERREDIPALVWAIIRKRQRVLQRHITAVPSKSSSAAALLVAGQYPRTRERCRACANPHVRHDAHAARGQSGSARRPDRGGDDAHVGGARAHQEVLHDCRWRINGIGNAASGSGSIRIPCGSNEEARDRQTRTVESRDVCVRQRIPGRGPSLLGRRRLARGSRSRDREHWHQSLAPSPGPLA